MEEHPAGAELVVLSSDDALLSFCNVWDSGRGLGPYESQMATSGMIREPVDGGFRHRCSAIQPEPAFDQLVFTLTRS